MCDEPFCVQAFDVCYDGAEVVSSGCFSDAKHDYYMLSYSPYDSMADRGYPAMLVAAGCATLRYNAGRRQNG